MKHLKILKISKEIRRSYEEKFLSSDNPHRNIFGKVKKKKSKIRKGDNVLISVFL